MIAPDDSRLANGPVTARVFLAAHAPEVIPDWFYRSDRAIMYAEIGRFNRFALCKYCRTGGVCDGTAQCDSHRAYEARRAEWEDTIPLRWRVYFADSMLKLLGLLSEDT